MALRKLCMSDREKSIFKWKIEFKEYGSEFRDDNGNPIRKFKIMYSNDYEDERTETKRTKPITQYNGFKKGMEFVLKIHSQNNLHAAYLYANLRPDRPLLNCWVAEEEEEPKEDLNQNF